MDRCALEGLIPCVLFPSNKSVARLSLTLRVNGRSTELTLDRYGFVHGF